MNLESSGESWNNDIKTASKLSIPRKILYKNMYSTSIIENKPENIKFLPAKSLKK
jgi:hypothetical protein